MKKMTDKTIVVPWDFSDMARDALQQALAMAGSPDQIRVVHVTPYPPATEHGIVWGDYSEQMIEDRLVENFRSEFPLGDDPPLHLTIMFGDPGSQIVAFAKQEDAGLIIISSHGRTGFSRFLMGSVAERVVRMAPCPVLVLRESKNHADPDKAEATASAS